MPPATDDPRHDQPLHNPGALLRLLDVTRRLATPFELVDVLRVIVDAGRAVLRADRGSVYLYDAATRELYTVVATGVESIRVSIDTGLAGLCAKQRQIINIDDCYADPRFNRAMDAQTGYCTTCCLSIPLVGVDNELVGVLQLLNAADGSFNADDVVVAEVLAAQAATAVQRVRLIDERLTKLKLERDLAIARDIQQALLPRQAPAVPGYELACYNKPADDTGGDLYDVIRVEGEGDGGTVMLMLADATGHGIGPALSVTQLRAMVRVGLRYTTSLEQLVQHVNEQVARDLPPGRFTTAFMGELDASAHRLTWHAPGQGPTLWLHAASGEVETFDATTLPLGVLPDLPPEPPRVFDLLPGDVVVLLTDGFYEFTHPDGHQQFGRCRVVDAILRRRTQSAQAMLDGLLDELRAWAAGAPQLDDLTAIIVKREG